MGLFTKLFGTRSEREVKRIMPLVDRILSLEEEYKNLSEEELKGKTALFRERLEKPSRYVMRSNNREIASRIGRPESYDRVALKICSIYCLSHWEDDSTIRNYLNKKLAPRESMTELSGLI